MAVNLQDYIKKQDERIKALEDMCNELGWTMRGAKKRRFTKKTQNVRWDAMHRALCVSTLDHRKENRVRYYHPIFHNPETPLLSLPWARPVSSMGGFDDCGLNWVPPAGSTIVLFFENGYRDAAYYFGTTWHRNRGPENHGMGYPVPEYENVYSGHRKGYLVGPNDESQVYPPWVSESYNSGDVTSFLQFSHDTNEQKKLTYPNIYGFKTPEKHMLKMVDGDAKCDRRWKRLELLSGCGNWLIFKDDHLHYGGQWSHPDCGPEPGGSSVNLCSESDSSTPYFTDPHGRPIEEGAKCNDKVSSDKIMDGHPSTPSGTTHHNSNRGANKYFRHKNECRPYKGPGTPQNNRCDLPQSGFQLLSISGHTIVADDSVEEPEGKPIWERSTESFNFGCNDKFLGRFYIKSATGHGFSMSDEESETGLRSEKNGIKLLSAAGNRIELNDHTVGQKGDVGCPPNYAGEQRGIMIESTSSHHIFLSDHMNKQCAPFRTEGGEPQNKASEAYMEFRSGYGLEMQFRDDNSQEETQNQWIQILHPQKSGDGDSSANEERGPHFLRFQGRPQGSPGIVYLRAGGHAIRQTYDMDIVIVGDKEKNPSDKFTYVSKQHVRATEKTDFRYSGERHIFFAEEQILLMAGRDCPPPEGKKCRGPCLYPVVIGRCPVVCPFTGIIHWTEKSLSERVFASAKNPDICDGGTGETTEGEPAPCRETEEETEVDTGNGVITIESPTLPPTTVTDSGGTQLGPIADSGDLGDTIY